VLINRKITALCNETTSSSFALFNGKHSVDSIPYQSSPKFLMREQDKNFLSNLREWMITYKFEDGNYDAISFLMNSTYSLKSLYANVCFVLYL